MTDDERAELERLREQVARLEASHKPRVDGGLGRLAGAAQRERMAWQTLQAGGDVHVPEIHDTALVAASYVMKDLGL